MKRNPIIFVKVAKTVIMDRKVCESESGGDVDITESSRHLHGSCPHFRCLNCAAVHNEENDEPSGMISTINKRTRFCAFKHEPSISCFIKSIVIARVKITACFERIKCKICGINETVRMTDDLKCPICKTKVRFCLPVIKGGSRGCLRDLVGDELPLSCRANQAPHKKDWEHLKIVEEPDERDQVG